MSLIPMNFAESGPLKNVIGKLTGHGNRAAADIADQIPTGLTRDQSLSVAEGKLKLALADIGVVAPKSLWERLNLQPRSERLKAARDGVTNLKHAAVYAPHLSYYNESATSAMESAIDVLSLRRGSWRTQAHWAGERARDSAQRSLLAIQNERAQVTDAETIAGTRKFLENVADAGGLPTVKRELEARAKAEKDATGAIRTMAGLDG